MVIEGLCAVGASMSKRKPASRTALAVEGPKHAIRVEFCSNPGKAYSRESLLRLVWGYQFTGYEHTVNSHINRLRAKIENRARIRPLGVQRPLKCESDELMALISLVNCP